MVGERMRQSLARRVAGSETVSLMEWHQTEIGFPWDCKDTDLGHSPRSLTSFLSKLMGKQAVWGGIQGPLNRAWVVKRQRT